MTTLSAVFGPVPESFMDDRFPPVLCQKSLKVSP